MIALSCVTKPARVVVKGVAVADAPLFVAGIVAAAVTAGLTGDVAAGVLQANVRKPAADKIREVALNSVRSGYAKVRGAARMRPAK